MSKNVIKLTGKLEGIELVGVKSSDRFAIGGKIYDFTNMSRKLAERYANDPKLEFIRMSEPKKAATKELPSK